MKRRRFYENFYKEIVRFGILSLRFAKRKLKSCVFYRVQKRGERKKRWGRRRRSARAPSTSPYACRIQIHRLYVGKVGCWVGPSIIALAIFIYSNVTSTVDVVVSNSIYASLALGPTYSTPLWLTCSVFVLIFDFFL